MDHRTGLNNARFEVLTEVLLGIQVSWEAALCRWVDSSLDAKFRVAFVFRAESRSRRHSSPSKR